MEAEPARAPFADVLDLHLAQADPDGVLRLARRLRRRRRNQVVPFVDLLALVELADHVEPGVLPVLVYLSEIEKLTLDDATPRTRVLRDAPVVVNLAVLES